MNQLQEVPVPCLEAFVLRLVSCFCVNLAPGDIAAASVFRWPTCRDVPPSPPKPTGRQR